MHACMQLDQLVLHYLRSIPDEIGNDLELIPLLEDRAKALVEVSRCVHKLDEAALVRV